MYDAQSLDETVVRRSTERMLPQVSTATAIDADQARVVALVVSAFAADPAARWMYPDARSYDAHFPEFVKAFGGRAFASGTVHRIGDVAAALWLPPGAHPYDDAVTGLIRRTTPAHQQPALFELFEQMGSYRPPGLHWHLPLIAVHPGSQRQGYGAALLRHALKACDEQRLPAYLESSNPENIPLYQRHGFAVLGTIQIGSSPPVTPMLRTPR
jgi:ribosomal protein S18 acetylase RimI-like enzyme